RLPGYEVQELIGRGAMGEVYRARQLGLNRLVAVKMLPQALRDVPDRLRRFQTEAEAGAPPQHPHIVQILPGGPHAGAPLLSMELGEGGSLAERRAAPPLRARRAAGLVQTLAGAMQHAHEKGILHRDLKPANVLLAGEASGGRQAPVGDAPTGGSRPPLASTG